MYSSSAVKALTATAKPLRCGILEYFAHHHTDPKDEQRNQADAPRATIHSNHVQNGSVLTSIQPLGSSMPLRASVNCSPRSMTQWGSLSLTRNGVESQNMCLCSRAKQGSFISLSRKENNN